MPRKTTDQLTVDYKTISSIPISSRVKLASDTAFREMIQSQLTPGQIASLFPKYYLEGINPLAGQKSEFPNMLPSDSKAAMSAGLSGYSGAQPNAKLGKGTTSQRDTATPSKPLDQKLQNDSQRKALGGVPAPLAQKAVEAAMRNEGRNERQDREALRDYIKTGGTNLDPATTAWCAAYVNASLAAAGIKGSGSNIANSFQTYGTGVDPRDIQPGDVVVETRGKGPGESGGHVTMATGNVQKNDRGEVIAYEVIGGNEGDAVGKPRYVYIDKHPDFMVRRATENEVKDPEVLQAYKSQETAKTQQVADQTQTDEQAKSKELLAVNQTTDPSKPKTTDDSTAQTVTQNTDKQPTVPKVILPEDTPAGVPTQTSTVTNDPTQDPQTAQTASNQQTVTNQTVETVPNAQAVAQAPIPQALTEPTVAMARGGEIDTAHLAVPLDGKGPNKLIGEAGPETVVPRNKIIAGEVGQQDYQRPSAATNVGTQQPAQPTPANMPQISQPNQMAQQPNPIMQQGGMKSQQATPSTSGINVDHPMVPVSARKAFADAKMEPRLNNLSPIGTVYVNHGAA